MGAERLGVNSLFTSVLSVISLAELGIDSAITYSMYKPIAEGDTDTVCGLLNVYRKLYRYVGLFILAVGTIGIPFLRYLISGEVPEDLSLPLVYLIFLGNTVAGYLLYAHKRSLLIALQRNDYVSNVSTIIVIFQNVAQVAVYALTKNYYLYAFVLIVCTVATNLLFQYLSNKYYGEYQPKGTVTAEVKGNLKKQIGGLMITKLCVQSRNAFDNIVVSAVLGLALVTIYSNYFYVINAVHSVLGAILISITSSIGNSIAVESKEKNLQDLKKIQFLYIWMSIWAMTCTALLYSDFMTIWVGEELVLPFVSAMIFSVYGFVLCLGDVNGAYADANGVWWHNRKFSVMETVINIVLNIVLCHFLGVNGIIIASIIATAFSNFGYMPYTVFKHYFGLQYLKKQLLSLLMYLIAFGISVTLSILVSNTITATGILKMIIQIAVASVIAPALMVISSLRNSTAKEAFQLVLAIVKRTKPKTEE